MRGAYYYLKTDDQNLVDITDRNIYKFERKIILNECRLMDIEEKNNTNNEVSIKNNLILAKKKSELGKLKNLNEIHCNLKRRRENSIVYTEEQIKLINKINKPVKKMRLSKIYSDKEEISIGNTNFKFRSKDDKQFKDINLLKEIQIYEPMYRNHFKEFKSKSFKHEFMIKNFPNNYNKIENFIKIVKNNKKKIFNDSCKIFNKNELNFIKNLPGREDFYYSYSESDEFLKTNNYKKIWSTGRKDKGNLIDDRVIKLFIDKTILIWDHEKINYSQEVALELLMKNRYDIEITLHLIKKKDEKFLDLISKPLIS